MIRKLVGLSVGVGAVCAVGLAEAQGEEPAAPGTAEAPEPAASAASAELAPAAPSTTAEATAPASATSDTPWLERFRPQGIFAEVGIFVGVLAPSADHNFHDELRVHQSLSPAAFDFGARAAFFPQPWLGLEGEVMLAPSSTDDGQGATVWAGRLHAVAALPLLRVQPFVVLGGGRMGAMSDPLADDADPLFHFGLGAKLAVNELVLARFDVRDNLTQKNGGSLGSAAHHPEVLLGLTFLLPPWKEPEVTPAAPTDRDADGVMDPADRCPNEPGVAPDGCPVRDADGDSFADEVDRCPDKRGVAPHGCPPVDSDEDGFFDDTDTCPNEAGVAPDGCPAKDTDGDSLLDPDDKCPKEAETRNGFEDGDGCPDELPQAVLAFTGVIRGIEFETARAVIRPDSKAILDQAVAVLKQFVELHLQVVGHTDNVGDAAKNLDLSKRRAEAVMKYLVDHGIDASRVEAQGVGSEQPLMGNDTAAGRAKNRRIEFKIVPAK